MSEVFKVQASIPDGETLLIYNKDHSVMAEMPTAPGMAELLDGEMKLYIHGELDLNTGELTLGDIAPWQDW